MFEKEAGKYASEYARQYLHSDGSGLTNSYCETYKGYYQGANDGYNKGYHDAEKHYMNVIDSQQKLVAESKAKQNAEEAEENRKLKLLVKALLYEINQIWDINEMDPDVREAAEQIEKED